MSNPISTDPPAQFFREVSIDHTSPAALSDEHWAEPLMRAVYEYRPVWVGSDGVFVEREVVGTTDCLSTGLRQSDGLDVLQEVMAFAHLVGGELKRRRDSFDCLLLDAADSHDGTIRGTRFESYSVRARTNRKYHRRERLCRADSGPRRQCEGLRSTALFAVGSHLLADSEEELDAFAARIGLKYEWGQHRGIPGRFHYDVIPSKRALAIRHGAIEIDDKELVAIIRPQWAAFEQHRDLGGRPQPESEHPRKLSHARNS